ncbi:hypothetical protein CB0940_06077 [Cercospora beticola]|uniref:Uncharacterized protein n=1 Tax=Cercospora beticola TaxID=122368 RepID=A0A2G5HZU6_CERBT|nr:hypothetical protein CB0940_06077 [Cercospora beticola]PIA98058.1 hypothetical protein CB0940_06077 [Cercospora beticola]WPA98691.1 hypothetical protein RHO25_003304 [Cercospora beticola]
MILRSRTIAPALQLATRNYATKHEPRQVLNAEVIARLQQQEQAIANRQRNLPPPGSDKYFYLTAIGLILATPPIIYYWWQHRAEHMGKKKEDMLKQIEIKRKEFLESQR